MNYIFAYNLRFVPTEYCLSIIQEWSHIDKVTLNLLINLRLTYSFKIKISKKMFLKFFQIIKNINYWLVNNNDNLTNYLV